MAEEQKKGVIVEFDFAAMNGAELLYKTAETVLKEGEIPFDVRIEAQYLAGGNCLGGLTEYFEAIKTKKTAAKAAKDIADGFREALNKALPAAVSSAFKGVVLEPRSNGVENIIASLGGGF